MQLLLCESNRSSAVALRDFLASRGFDVVTASNGLEALRNSIPDIVVIE